MHINVCRTGKSSPIHCSTRTAEWETGVDLTGKGIAVIGTGSATVQVVPKIAKVARELFVFQRTPTWSPKSENKEYHELLQKLFGIFSFFMTVSSKMMIDE